MNSWGKWALDVLLDIMLYTALGLLLGIAVIALVSL
jgi:hypothetical protein